MANQITDPPLHYNAGRDFDYSVWSQDTKLSFHRVAWDNNYRDIVTYGSDEDFNTYLNTSHGPALTISKVTYHRPNVPVTVNISLSEMMTYNYIRVSNPRQPVNGDTPRHWYYFILDAVHVAPNTTRLMLQLDVWQSFGRHVTFGNSYVEQGHIGVANTSNFRNNGRDFLTTPEGLNTGTEYQTIAARSEKVISTRTDDHAIMVVSTVDLTADGGTNSDPKLETARGGKLHGLPSGASQYFFNNVNDFTGFMANVAGKPWISQGIVSISLTPKLSRYKITTTDVNVQGSPAKIPTYVAGESFKKKMWENWRNSKALMDCIPERYRHLRKLWTFPYMAIELTAWSGTPIILKPESWNDPDALIHERANFLPPSQRVAIYPRNYNKGEFSTTAGNIGGVGQLGSEDDGGEFLDLFTQLNAFPTFSVVNNGALGYMATNAHGLAYSAASADWSQQVALRGAQTSYDQSSGAMSTANEQTRLSTNADIMQTNLSNQTAIQTAGLNAVTGMVGSTAGGAMSGGPAGAAVGAAGGAAGALTSAISTGINTSAATTSSGIRTGTANAANAANQGQSALVRDTNYDLSTFAAKGNYQNAIAGINAKVQDAQLTQPSTSGQVGGESLHAIYDNVEYSVRWKMIDAASIAVIGEYWLRYGYAVRRFISMPSTLHCMTHFTYWKLSETYIKTAPIPESYKQVIRGIFEKGVTVWKSADMIGSTDIGVNKPVGGFAL